MAAILGRASVPGTTGVLALLVLLAVGGRVALLAVGSGGLAVLRLAVALLLLLLERRYQYVVLIIG